MDPEKLDLGSYFFRGESQDKSSEENVFKKNCFLRNDQQPWLGQLVDVWPGAVFPGPVVENFKKRLVWLPVVSKLN